MMTKRLLFASFLWMVTALSLSAQSLAAEVATAFGKGDAQALAIHLGDKVNLLLEAENLQLERGQATERLTRFFARNRVTSFRVNHEGQRDDSAFLVGTLTTDSGRWRVNCFFKRVGGRHCVHQIRIERAND